MNHRFMICAALATCSCDAQQNDAARGKPAAYWVEQLVQKRGNHGAEALGALDALGEEGTLALLQPLEDKAIGIGDLSIKLLRKLGKLGPKGKKAIPALVDRLRGSEVNAMESEIEALANMGAEAAGPLIEALRNPGYSGGRGVCVALGKIGPQTKEVVPALIEALKNRKLQVYAAEALRAIGPKARDSIPALFEALRNGMDFSAADAIASVGTDDLPAILAALEDESAAVRMGAVRSLGIMRPKAKAAVSGLVKALKKEGSSDAAYALGRFGPDAKDGVPVLVEALKDKSLSNNALRYEAVRALGEINAEAELVVPALVAVTRDDRPEALSARIAAIQSLGKFGPRAKGALADLKRISESETPSVPPPGPLQEVAAEAVREIER